MITKHNMKNKLTNKKNIYLLLFLFIIVACRKNASLIEKDVIVPTSLKTTTVSTDILLSPTESIKTPTISNNYSPAPTARVFDEIDDCGFSDTNGHIFFLSDAIGIDVNGYRSYDLNVMNGNGCFPKVVMNNVFGSPSWSKDTDYLAIGCDNYSFLCILDVKATLENCVSGSEFEIGRCNAKVIKKIKLPSEIVSTNKLYDISWSPDDTQIAIAGGDEVNYIFYLYVLTLSAEDQWQMLVERSTGKFTLDWSPNDEKIAFGSYWIDADGKNLKKMIDGWNPAWSSDGKALAFVAPSDDETREFYGIKVMDLNNGKTEWLYEPAKRDDFYWPPRDLIIEDFSGRRLIDWSPDAKYIVFASKYYNNSSSGYLFRLEVDTGEIIFLTQKLQDVDSYHSFLNFYAPSWGP